MQIIWNTEVNAPGCPGEVLSKDGESILIQSDWDYPGIASTFGWSIQRLQRCRECGALLQVDPDCQYMACYECSAPIQNCCDHQHTDGTLGCPCCGITASEFISDARDWLDANDGATAEDPGYFCD